MRELNSSGITSMRSAHARIPVSCLPAFLIEIFWAYPPQPEFNQSSSNEEPRNPGTDMRELNSSGITSMRSAHTRIPVSCLPAFLIENLLGLSAPARIQPIPFQ